MITLEKLLTELKAESFNEIIAGTGGKSGKSHKKFKSSSSSSKKHHSCGCPPPPPPPCGCH